ncbi:MAG: twin-arginine translocase TatA/TatE family subunit [Thermoprotei archaeon]
MLDNPSDWLIFILVALLLFGGSSKIPELARGLGRAVGEFRKAQIEVEREINTMVNEKPGSAQIRGVTTVEQTRPVENQAQTTDANTKSVDKRIEELEAEINELRRMLDKH